MRSLLVLMVSLAAGCGENSDGINQLPDAPRFLDAPFDAPTSGLVTLTITRGGTTGVADVRVHFQNADSSVVLSTTTNANGVASATMEPGGFVTAVDAFPAPIPQGGPQTHDLHTFAGVEPGDQLRLDDNEPALDEISVTLVAPLDDDPDATFYTLYAPCIPFGRDITNRGGGSSLGGPPNPGGLITFEGCGATTDLTIVSGDELRSFHVSGVALVEGETINLVGQTYANTQEMTWEFSQAPLDVSSVNVQSFLVTARGQVFAQFGEASFNDGTAVIPDPEGGPRGRPVVANAVQVQSSRFFGGKGLGTHQVIEWGAPGTYSLELGSSTFVPTYATFPEVDRENHRFTWTVDEGGQQPDLVIARAGFSAGKGSLRWNWEIAAPHGADRVVVLPVLPGDDDQFNTSEAESSDVDDLTTAVVPGGYDAVRAKLLSLDDPTGLVVGPTGKVVLEEVQRGERRARPASKVLRPWIRTPKELRARSAKRAAAKSSR